MCPDDKDRQDGAAEGQPERRQVPPEVEELLASLYRPRSAEELFSPAAVAQRQAEVEQEVQRLLARQQDEREKA